MILGAKGLGIDYLVCRTKEVRRIDRKDDQEYANCTGGSGIRKLDLEHAGYNRPNKGTA